MAELLRQAEEKSRLLRQTGSSSLDLVQGTQLLEVIDNCTSCIFNGGVSIAPRIVSFDSCERKKERKYDDDVPRQAQDNKQFYMD
eukprot:COSAG06_NODE_1302_length_9933_cov_7.954342_13_plen_85_part_00